MLNIQSFVNTKVLFFFILLIGLLIPNYMVWESRKRVLVEKAHLSKSNILNKKEKIKWRKQLYRTHESGCADSLLEKI
ncbi:hypothetical protein [Leptospira noguchii]|uniref:hypothetical protein n=1 Tax=Leptospira noguchii TaxID=28182 RepID=UPI0007736CC5|nr:hypothetical protein [Leptospira noguchii]UOG61914.1 hypothetical protein MAL07_08060 [Leptospira noguchii]